MERIAFSSILRATARQAGLTVEELLAPTRCWRRSHPRQRAALLGWRLRPDLTVEAMATRMGLQNHTTVVHARRVAAQRLASNAIEQSAMAEVLALLGVDELPPEPKNRRRLAIVQQQLRLVERRRAALLAELEAVS